MSQQNRSLSYKKIRHILLELLRKDPNDEEKAENQPSTSRAVTVGAKPTAVSSMTRVINLASSCVRSHRWEAAAKSFPAIARYVSNAPNLVWKIGASCMAYHPDSNKTTMSNFADSMIKVSRSAAPEILLDHTTYLMCNGDYEGAKQFIENNKKKWQKCPSDTVLSVIEGTRGLLEYILWHNAIKARENIDGALSSLDLVSDSASHIQYSERAICFLKNSLRCQGNFDIFVQKLVEILEYYERLDEADEVLEFYIQLNHLQPSPYVYLYNFICRNFPADVPRQVYVLKELAKYCQCHEGVIRLCKLLPNDELELKIQLLFDLVDYCEWKDEIDVWKLLVDSLLSANIRKKSHLEQIHRFVEDRSVWWMGYHFCNKQVAIDDQNIRHLLVYKALIAVIIYKPEHNFVVSVSDKLNEVGDEDKFGLFNDLFDKAKQLNAVIKAFALQQAQPRRISINVGLNNPIQINEPLVNTSSNLSPPSRQVQHTSEQEPRSGSPQAPQSLLTSLLSQPVENYEQFKFTESLINLHESIKATNKMGTEVQNQRWPQSRVNIQPKERAHVPTKLRQILPAMQIGRAPPGSSGAQILYQNGHESGVPKSSEVLYPLNLFKNRNPLLENALRTNPRPPTDQILLHDKQNVAKKSYGPKKVAKVNQAGKKVTVYSKQSPMKEDGPIILSIESRAPVKNAADVIVIPTFKPSLQVKNVAKKRPRVGDGNQAFKKGKLEPKVVPGDAEAAALESEVEIIMVVEKKQPVMRSKTVYKDCVVVMERLTQKTIDKFTAVKDEVEKSLVEEA